MSNTEDIYGEDGLINVKVRYDHVARRCECGYRQAARRQSHFELSPWGVVL